MKLFPDCNQIHGPGDQTTINLIDLKEASNDVQRALQDEDQVITDECLLAMDQIARRAAMNYIFNVYCATMAGIILNPPP